MDKMPSQITSYAWLAAKLGCLQLITMAGQDRTPAVAPVIIEKTGSVIACTCRNQVIK